MWILACKWCSVCSSIRSRLPVTPQVPCQSLHPQHSMAAICHSELQGLAGGAGSQPPLW